MNHQPMRRLWGALIIALMALGAQPALACCHPTGTQADDQTFLQSVPVSPRDRAQASVGEGEHAYRFVVRHPQHTQQPWRRAAYQVATSEGVTWEGGPEVHQGLTDEQGRTAVLRSRSPIALSDWVVLPTWGKGPQGRSFRLVDQNEQGVAAHPYLIDAVQGPVQCGHSLPGGRTARLQTAQPTHLRLYTSGVDVDECRKLSAVLNPLMADADPRRQIMGLQRLLGQGWSATLQERLQNKLIDALLAKGDEAEIRALAARWVAEPGISHRTLAERFNSAGYGLIERHPPRLVNLAESLLAQGLALSPSPAILDSHAWALHALGRHDEALVGIEVATEGFLQSCTEDDEIMYQETLAHRAQVLAALGREQEALDAWVQVYRLNRQANWAASVRLWPQVQAAVEAEVVRREQAGEPAPLGCVDTRDQRFVSGELAMPAALSATRP